MADNADPVIEGAGQDGAAGQADRTLPLKSLESERAKRQAAEAKAAEAAAEVERIKAEHAAALAAEATDAKAWRDYTAAEVERTKASNAAALAALDETKRAAAEAAIDGLDGKRAAAVLALIAAGPVVEQGHPRGVATPTGDPRASGLTPEEKAFKASNPILSSASDAAVKRSFAAQRPAKR